MARIEDSSRVFAECIQDIIAGHTDKFINRRVASLQKAPLFVLGR
jgi:hypothetical protein